MIVFGMQEMVELLAAADADSSIKNEVGATAMDMALHEKYLVRNPCLIAGYFASVRHCLFSDTLAN